MAPSLELIVLPLHRQKNQDLPTYPGLYTAQPGARVARGRSQEQLVIYFFMEGSAPLSPSGFPLLLPPARP